MYFSVKALEDLQSGLAAVPGKDADLQKRFLRYSFQKERAKEFAHHGFIRRLNILARCIENVFSLIPPERVDPVERELRKDVEINIQASVFNVFAAADNLAWIWVIEKEVRQEDGSELPASWVGLRRNNSAVRGSLPDSLREKIEGFDEWFDIVDEYRHALAHRIPLYIPPYNVDPRNEAAYAKLNTQKEIALFQGNSTDYERLQAEQKALEFFRPWMTHSFGEKARPLVFHPQLLANFNTVEELGRDILEALQHSN